jgi:hypothetical protein
MYMLSPKRLLLMAVVFAVLLTLEMNTPASAQMVRPMEFKDLVDQADQVVVGTCTERKAVMVNGAIVTQYKIKPSEFWKGHRDLSASGEFTMSEMGGALEHSRVPLAQYAPGSSDMLPGEDVLLFLQDPKPAVSAAKPLAPFKKGAPSAKSAVPTRATLPATPAVVGLWQGRFSVITHPRNGQKLIARTNVSAIPGSPLNPTVRENLLKAQGIKASLTPSGAKIAVLEKSSLLPQAKLDALAQQIDAARAEAQKAHAEAAKHSSAGADEIYQFESVDSIKARVLRLAKGKK